MRKVSLLAILFLVNLNIAMGQSYEGDQKRYLRLIHEVGDSIVWKLKKNKFGEIVKLNQEYFEKVNGEKFSVAEKFIKDKKWVLNRYKLVPGETKVKSDSNKIIYEHILEGGQYSFNQAGQIAIVENYVDGALDGTRVELSYYPDGKLRFIGEYKYNYSKGKMDIGNLWNVIDYRFPDGSPHEYGNYKNGKGHVDWLDIDGNPCEDFEN